MLPQEIIRKKRDGQVLPANEIADFISGLVDGRVTDAQAAAFAMAVFFKGMTMDERVKDLEEVKRLEVELVSWLREAKTEIRKGN